MRPKIVDIIVILVILFIVFTLGLLVKDRSYFSGDTARDVLIVELMKKGSYLPSIGHENNLGYNLPIYYYLLYGFSFLTSVGYKNLQLFFIVGTFVGAIFLHFLLQELKLSKITSVFFVTTYLLSNNVLHSSDMWSVNLILPLSLVFTYCTYKALLSNRPHLIIYALIPLFLAISIDLSAALLILVVFFSICKIKTSPKNKLLLLLVLTTLFLFFIFWLLYVNAHAYGSIEQYFALFPQLLTGFKFSVSWIDIITHYFEGSVWLPNQLMSHFKLISQGIWFLILFLFISIFLKSPTRTKLSNKFIIVFIGLVLMNLIIYKFISGKLLFHHLTSIYFIPILILAVLWSNSGKLIKSMLFVYMGCFIFLSMMTLIQDNYGYPDYEMCLKTAQGIKSVAQNQPFALLYFDTSGLEDWETTKYVYCLRQVNIDVSMAILGGSFNINDQVHSSLLNPPSGILPETILLLCSRNEFNACDKALLKDYSTHRLLFGYDLIYGSVDVYKYTAQKNILNKL